MRTAVSSSVASPSSESWCGLTPASSSASTTSAFPPATCSGLGLRLEFGLGLTLNWASP